MNRPPTGRPSSGLPTGDLLDTEHVTVDLATPGSVLAIGAHPDDIEFGAGATLARWARAGSIVHHLVLTDGSKGSWDPDADLDALVATRRQECVDAAARLTGDTAAGRVHFLDHVDGELVNDVDTRRSVAEAIRSVRPDVVLGHDPWRRYRLHPDHRAAGFLTMDAIVAARDPHFFAELDLPPHRPVDLLLWEADLVNHVEASPADAVSAKVQALLCHRSQRQTTMGVDADGDEAAASDELATRIAWQTAQHGAVAGIPAGEAFHHIDQL